MMALLFELNKLNFLGEKYNMEKYRIIKIHEQPELRNSVANWFHEKWDISIEAYLESINECIRNQSTIP